MGERLTRAKFMPLDEVKHTLQVWRKLGESKVNILGSEPTLHPDFITICHCAQKLGYEKVILNTNGVGKVLSVLDKMFLEEISYVQNSLDGGTRSTHDAIRGPGTFRLAWRTLESLTARKFDTRIICTVNHKNRLNCLELISKCESIWGKSREISRFLQYRKWTRKYRLGNGVPRMDSILRRT